MPTESMLIRSCANSPAKTASHLFAELSLKLKPFVPDPTQAH